MPNYKVRFKPFFEPLYDHSLYKTNIDEILLRNATKDLEEEQLEAEEGLLAARRSSSYEDDTGGTNFGGSEATLRGSSSSNDLKSVMAAAEKKSVKKKLVAADLATRLKIDKSANKLFRYRQLCEKIGMDLTTVGRLSVSLKICDRFPEALYSLNVAVPIMGTTATQQTSSQVPSAQSIPVNPSSSSSSINSTKEQQVATGTTTTGQINRLASLVLRFFFQYIKISSANLKLIGSIQEIIQFIVNFLVQKQENQQII